MTSAEVISSSKGQPAVLQLLPFSTNWASTASTVVRPESRPHVSYADADDSSRNFPVLAVTRTPSKAKHRSKSASVALCNISSPSLDNRNQQRRLLRTSSERFSKLQAAKNSDKSRSKSEYGMYSTSKTVRCSVKDINDEVLGGSYNIRGDGDVDTSFSPDHLHSTSDMVLKKTKTFSKPSIKTKEASWHLAQSRFWKSSTVSSGEMELLKHKIGMDVNSRISGKQSRIKLNVNDLPRSKTPISENDPDKLNMQHVIAFLQNNSKENESEVQPVIKANKSPKERLILPPSIRHSQQGKHPEADIPKASSPFKVEKNGRHYVIKPRQANNTNPAERSIVYDSSQTTFRHSSFRPKSYHGNVTDRLMTMSDYALGGEERPRPNSIQAIATRSVPIPENIRKIREREKKPFRLHRFVTLVPNSSKNLINSAESKSVHFQSSRKNSIESSRSVDRPSQYTKQKMPPPRCLATGSSTYINQPDIGDEGVHNAGKHRRKRSSREDNDIPFLNLPVVDKAIFLPSAQYETDSDEENSPPFPTMPNSRNRRARNLSAQGRAITPSPDLGVQGNARSSPVLSRPNSRKDRPQFYRENHDPYEGKPGSRERNVNQSRHYPNKDKITDGRTSSFNIELSRSSTSVKPRHTEHSFPSNVASEYITSDQESPEPSPKAHSLPDWAKNEQRQQTQSSPNTTKSVKFIETNESPVSPTRQQQVPASPIRQQHQSPGSPKKKQIQSQPSPSREQEQQSQPSPLRQQQQRRTSQPSPTDQQQSFFLTSMEAEQPVRALNDGNPVQTSNKTPAKPVATVTPKFSLRKERNRTREMTYMEDMAIPGRDNHIPKITSLNSPYT